MRLGVTYPSGQLRQDLDGTLIEQYDRQPIYVVDATGLDQPIINYLRQEIEPGTHKAVHITAA